MDPERTFFMIKPDGVQRNLIGRIINRVEEKGYKITAMKMLLMDRDTAERHYEEHKEKPFFTELVDFITSGPVVVMVVEGENAIDGMRKMMGKTDPKDSTQGSIRGDLGINLSRNVIHGSDSSESAAREIGIFFHEGEIIDYSRIDEKWIYP